MKKQFLLLVIITMLCICFCTLSGNKLQACDANVAECGVIKTTMPVIKEAPAKSSAEHEDEFDLPANYLMNPFITM